MKLTPNVTNVVMPARHRSSRGAHALSLINTLNSIVGVDLEALSKSRRASAAKAVTADLPPVRRSSPIALNMLRCAGDATRTDCALAA